MFQIWEMESGVWLHGLQEHLHISILGSSVFCFCVFLAHSILSWIYAKRVLVSSQKCIYIFSRCSVSFPGVIRSGFSLQDATRAKMLSLVQLRSLEEHTTSKGINLSNEHEYLCILDGACTYHMQR